MKLRSFRLPDQLVDDIEAEAHRRKVSVSEIARERLSLKRKDAPDTQPWKRSLADFVGAIDGLPHGDSRNIKAALKASGYGRNRSR
jgi:Arc/MetJ-type ribon-helix-helix transcriptional regulator